MKKLLIGSTVFLLALGAGVAPAAATGGLPEPTGEERLLNLVVPSAAGGCATSPGGIAGVEDLYFNYGDTSELVATWSMVEDAKGFLITATLVNKYYSLNNPLAPGRSTSATFSIPRCVNPGFLEPAPVVPDPVAPVAPVVTVPEPVVPAPVVPAPAAPVVTAPEPIVPVAAPAAPVPAVVVPVPVAPVPAVTPAPVAPAGPVVAVEVPGELANTGAREDRLLLLTGVGLVLALGGGFALAALRRSR